MGDAQKRSSLIKVLRELIGHCGLDLIPPRRLLARNSFRIVIQGLRPAKLHENESKPLHVFNGLAHIFDPAVVNRKREVIWPVTF